MLVVGGSSITAYAPTVYTSMDIDFAVLSGLDKPKLRKALLEIGFAEHGRVFQNPDTAFALDFVAETPFVDQQPIKTFQEMKTKYGGFKVFRLEDAIADRVAAFIHWSDSQSLEVAERALAVSPSNPSWKSLDDSLSQVEILNPDASARMDIARRRLKAALEKA